MVPGESNGGKAWQVALGIKLQPSLGIGCTNHAKMAAVVAISSDVCERGCVACFRIVCRRADARILVCVPKSFIKEEDLNFIHMLNIL